MWLPREKVQRPAWLLHLSPHWWVAGPDPESPRQLFLPVNQCLKNPTDDEPRSAPETDGGAPAGKGRVLLLEDDPAFQEIIADFLSEAGFTVVAVQTGREGVQQVLGGDFALVLCDLSMPTMPGDMFYRAVERIRPRLCECFIFMTGYRGDAKTAEFIKSIDGYVLQKPFPMKDLVDSIALAEVRRTFQSVFKDDAGEPGAGPPVDPRIASAALLQRAPALVAGTPESVSPPHPPDPRPRLPTISIPAPVPSRRAGYFVVAFSVVGLALFFSLVRMLDVRYRRARDGAAAAAAERLALEREWKVAAPQLEQAEKARSGLLALPKRARRVAEERSVVGWTKALRAASTHTGAEIELRGVMASGVSDAPGAYEIHLEGVAAGGAPRAIADGFYQALRRDLERTFPAAVVTELEKLEDEPELSALPRASFAIAVKIGANQGPDGERAAAK